MVAVTRTQRPGPGPFPARSLALRTGALVVVAAAVLYGTSTQPSPDAVPEVTVLNDGPYPLQVRVGRPSEEGSIDIGAVDANSTRRFLEVLDQGDTWRVSLRSGTVDLGDRLVPAGELAAGWAVPDEVHQHLEALGVRPVLSTDELARIQGAGQ